MSKECWAGIAWFSPAPSQLVESNLPSDGELAARVLDALLPHTGHARTRGDYRCTRVGKSTFIDALGMHLDPGARRERGGTERGSLRAPSQAAAFWAIRLAWKNWRWRSVPSYAPRRRKAIWAV